MTGPAASNARIPRAPHPGCSYAQHDLERKQQFEGGEARSAKGVSERILKQ